VAIEGATPARRGRLRLFTGPAPGVGKTTRLLEEARRLHARGLDVAVAFVDTRGRPALSALLEGLPRLPPRRVEHRGVVGAELDLDAVLARRPAVVVVDDLAHVNAPGSRHPRRYHDAQTLQAAGLDVMGTLGTYHLESLNEIVEKLTGVAVHETVPDSVLRGADAIVHVDVEPDVLIERLGTDALSDRAAWTRAHWLRPAALQALRELGFRQTAEALAARDDDSAAAVPRVSDRVMVCLSSFSPRAMALLRRGSRIAGRLNTHWFVVYVETPRESPSRIPDAVRRHLAESVEKARELGAEVVFLRARDPVRSLVDFARSHGVAHVVIGRSPVRTWRDWLGRSLVARMVREAHGLDLYVLATEESP
jgi:two-component system, OmpR family, sensor histidine kinase KdpD